MNETQEAPDYPKVALQNMAEMELKRGLVAAELDACEAEIRELYGPPGSGPAQQKRGALALEAILGDEEAASELEEIAARRAYLKRRAALCRDALFHADERLEALRRTWLTGHQAGRLPLEEIPEVLRERVRRARERQQESA
jgi:hypothetical protein